MCTGWLEYRSLWQGRMQNNLETLYKWVENIHLQVSHTEWYHLSEPVLHIKQFLHSCVRAGLNIGHSDRAECKIM